MGLLTWFFFKISPLWRREINEMKFQALYTTESKMGTIFLSNTYLLNFYQFFWVVGHPQKLKKFPKIGQFHSETMANELKINRRCSKWIFLPEYSELEMNIGLVFSVSKLVKKPHRFNFLTHFQNLKKIQLFWKFVSRLTFFNHIFWLGILRWITLRLFIFCMLNIILKKKHISKIFEAEKNS